MKATLRKIAAHCAWTPQGWLRHPILSFDASGLLVEVESCARIDHLPGVEFFSGLLVPGLVNAHAHLELSHLRGEIAPGGGFAAFADGMGAARGREQAMDPGQAQQVREQAMMSWDARMQREGVVAVGDVCNGASTFGLKGHSPIYYHNFIEYFGLAVRDFSTSDQVFEQAEALHLPCSRTPHSLYSLQDAPFRELMASGGASLRSIHFLESEAERSLFRGRGPLHERNERLGVGIDFAWYGSPTARLMASTSPETDLLLVHNTVASQQDIEALEAHIRGRLTWVLCPVSNQYIEGLLPPAAMLAELGLRVALGTDSLASSRTLSMLDQIRALSSQVELATLLGWATWGGAQGLGIDAWAGSFEVGKRPGAVLLDGVDWSTMRLTDRCTSCRLL